MVLASPLVDAAAARAAAAIHGPGPGPDHGHGRGAEAEASVRGAALALCTAWPLYALLLRPYSNSIETLAMAGGMLLALPPPDANPRSICWNRRCAALVRTPYRNRLTTWGPDFVFVSSYLAHRKPPVLKHPERE